MSSALDIDLSSLDALDWSPETVQLHVIVETGFTWGEPSIQSIEWAPSCSSGPDSLWWRESHPEVDCAVPPTQLPILLRGLGLVQVGQPQLVQVTEYHCVLVIKARWL